MSEITPAIDPLPWPKKRDLLSIINIQSKKTEVILTYRFHICNGETKIRLPKIPENTRKSGFLKALSRVETG